MLGRNKKNEDKGLTPFEIGKDRTAEEFCLANKQAFDKHSPDAQRELYRGAIQAFKEGRPENIQTVLSNPEEFKIFSYYYKNINALGTTEIPPQETLLALIEGSDDPAANVILAIAKVSERQSFLNDTLHRVVQEKDAETLADALLKAGADANAEYDGSPGLILARAASEGQPRPMIELLLKNGANFADTLYMMGIKGWEEDSIKKVKIHRQEITGQPATEEGELLEAVGLLRKELAEMQEDITSMAERLPPVAELQREPTSRPATRAKKAPQEKAVVEKPAQASGKQDFAHLKTALHRR